MEGVSGVGVSFGADRIFDVMTQLNLFTGVKAHGTSVMIINFGESELEYALNILETLHSYGLSAELYPEQAKIKKQMAYANARKISYVIIAGEDEIINNEITIKNMQTGEQEKIRLSNLENFFK